MPKCSCLQFLVHKKTSKIVPKKVIRQENSSPSTEDIKKFNTISTQTVQDDQEIPQSRLHSNLNDYHFPSNATLKNTFSHLSTMDPILYTSGCYDYSSSLHYMYQNTDTNHKEDYIDIMQQSDLTKSENKVRQVIYKSFCHQFLSLNLQFTIEEEVILRNQLMKEEASYLQKYNLDHSTNYAEVIPFSAVTTPSSLQPGFNFNVVTPSTNPQILSRIAESMWNMSDESDSSDVETIIIRKKSVNVLSIETRHDNDNAKSDSSSNNILSNFPSLHYIPSHTSSSSNPLLPGADISHENRLSSKRQIETNQYHTHNTLSISRDNSFTSNTHSATSAGDPLNVLGGHASFVSWDYPHEWY